MLSFDSSRQNVVLDMCCHSGFGFACTLSVCDKHSERFMCVVMLTVIDVTCCMMNERVADYWHILVIVFYPDFSRQTACSHICLLFIYYSLFEVGKHEAIDICIGCRCTAARGRESAEYWSWSLCFCREDHGVGHWSQGKPDRASRLFVVILWLSGHRHSACNKLVVHVCSLQCIFLSNLPTCWDRLFTFVFDT